MTAEPRNLREALAAQVLEEVDGVLTRAEALVLSVDRAGGDFERSTKALIEAGEGYRNAVVQFTAEAKSELGNYLAHLTSEVIPLTAEEQRAAMQEAARLAFRRESAEQAESLAKALKDALDDFTQSKVVRRTECAAIAFGSSMLTAILFMLLFSH